MTTELGSSKKTSRQRGFHFIVVMSFGIFPEIVKNERCSVQHGKLNIEYFSASFCTEGLINSDHISSFYDILKKSSV